MTEQNNGTGYLFTLTSFDGDGDRVAAPLAATHHGV